jgi:hypothetical protein
MPDSRKAPRLASILLGALCCICVACGGKSTVGSRATPRVINDAETYKLITQNLADWAEWKQGDGLYIDRDFLNCYELNGIPIPVATPLPDPSGHSRARRFCAEAEQAVIGQIPAFERLAAAVTAATVPDNSDQKSRFDDLVKARTERLKWAHAVEAAYKANDQQTLGLLLKQIASLESLEVKASSGVDTATLPTPGVRPTVPFIPGVPTSTPQRR